MSKYTTEVRFICETEAGYMESKGFNSIDSILDIAAPKIFNFDFPIFDENYRLPLEKKILRHYYTREISEETVGLWKLRLQDRLCMIMPYYNKLYESELIQFNPLYDVDVTRSHEGSNEGNEDQIKGINTEIDSSLDKTQSEAENLTSQKIDDATTGLNKIGKTTDSGTEGVTTTKNSTKTDDATTIDNVIGKSTDSGTERQVKDTDISEHTIRDEDISNDVITSHDYSLTEDKTKTINETTDDDLTNGKTITKTPGVKIRETTNGTKWDMHSDTPQGGLNGVISDDYLTDVHKIIDDNLITVREPFDNGYDTEANSGIDQRDIHLVGSHTENNTFTMDEDTGELTTRTEDEDITKTHADDTTINTTFGKIVDTSETKRSDYDNTSLESDTGASTTTFGKVVDNTESNITKFDNQTDETENRSTNIVGNDTLDRTEKTDISDSRHITNSDEYIEHVVGKQGGLTYSKMLIEFRDTFLNIDKMVIEDLSFCFFGLW